MSISLTGMASGLDTAAMIKVLLTNHQYAVERLNATKSNLQSEQKFFQAINTKLAALSNAAADLRLPNNFNLTSGKSSNENVVKVSTPEGAATGNYNIVVEQTAKSHSIKSGNINVNGGSLLGKNFTIQKDGSPLIDISTSGLAAGTKDGEVLDYIKNQINQKNAGITASVISVSDTEKVLVLTSQSTGEANKMTLTPPAAGSGQLQLGGSALGALGITNLSDTNTTTQPAEDAIIKVNNIQIQRSSNSITGVIEGATISIIDKGTSTVEIKRDTDKIADKIQKFVDAYNDVVSTVRSNLAKPEDKTKMNPLQGDSMLKEIESSLYNIFNSVAGTTEGYKMMSEIGLEIDKGITKASLVTGKITFDKSMFAEKFNANPDAVMDLFKKTDSGIMQAIDKQINNWTSAADGLLTTKIKGYNSEISFVDERLIAANNSMSMKEEQLKKQFAAMEVALSQLKSQQNWLSGVLASLTAANSNK